MREQLLERARPVLNQVNVIGSELDVTLAFYRRLGVDIPEDRVWRTATGAHHIAAVEDPDGLAVGLMSPISDEHRAPPPEV